jgi:hypothetical protein
LEDRIGHQDRSIIEPLNTSATKSSFRADGKDQLALHEVGANEEEKTG